MTRLPVDVLWIARYDYRAGWSLRLHHHNYLQMIHFLEGKGVFTVGGQSYPIRAGQLFFIRANDPHALRAETAVRTLDVKFRVAPGALARRLRRAQQMVELNEPGLAGRLERIRSEGERKAPWYREMCGTLLSEILYLYLRHEPIAGPSENNEASTEAASGDTIVERALAYIRAHYQDTLTVNEIARAAGCTDRTLRLHFQHTLRARPLNCLQGHRIARAKALIQYSDYTLKEVAGQTGFATVHHFTRHFTALEGRSPAAWRREYMAGIRKDVYINPRFENRSVTEGADLE